MSPDGLQLVIDGAQVDNSGQYTCQATNDAGIAELGFDVFVEGKTFNIPFNLAPLSPFEDLYTNKKVFSVLLCLPQCCRGSRLDCGLGDPD